MQSGDDDHQGGVTDAKYFPLMLNIFYSGGDREQVPGSSSQQRLSSSRMYKLWSGNNRDQVEHQPPCRQESGTVLWGFCQEGKNKKELLLGQLFSQIDTINLKSVKSAMIYLSLPKGRHPQKKTV